MDKPGNLMVVESLFWTAEPFDWDRYRDVTRERLWDRFPVFRSVVVRGDDGLVPDHEQVVDGFADALHRIERLAPR